MKNIKFSFPALFALIAIAIPSFGNADTVADQCREKIEETLKLDYTEYFFRSVKKGRKVVAIPLREIGQISCVMSRTSGPVGGPKAFDCEVSTTAALDEHGAEVGAGDVTFSVKVQSKTCAVLFTEITGEE